MSTLVIILARAGSKGLAGKNTRAIAGKPCAQWTIEAALEATMATRVVVSTDCARVCAVAEAFGVEIVDRPRLLASDTATVDDAARHALLEIERRDKTTFDGIALLYANVPVRPVGLIDNAIELMQRTGCDCVQSYAPVGKHHPWWMCRVEVTTGAVQPWEGNVLNHGVYRRQDLPLAFVPDGGILVVRRAALMLERGVALGPHAFLGVDRRGILTKSGDVIDIDTEIDAIVADTVLRQRLLVGSAP